MFIIPQGQDYLPRRVPYGIVLTSTIPLVSVNIVRILQPPLSFIPSLPGLSFYAVPCGCVRVVEAPYVFGASRADCQRIPDLECPQCGGSGRIPTRNQAAA